MNLRETSLPGIGQKYELKTRSGDQPVVVIHEDGRRELFHIDPQDPEEVLSSVTLDDDEARAVAAILAGITYKPKFIEEQEMMLDGLLIEWFRLEPGAQCLGKSIGQLHIRRDTGATILAVVEKSKVKHINPQPEYVFTAGATLVIAGERSQLKQLKQLLH